MSGRYASPPVITGSPYSFGRPRWDASLRGVNADRGEYKRYCNRPAARRPRAAVYQIPPTKTSLPPL